MLDRRAFFLLARVVWTGLLLGCLQIELEREIGCGTWGVRYDFAGDMVV